MRSGVTVLGFSLRQLSLVSSILIGLFIAGPNSAFATSPSANSGNEQILLLQGFGNMAPQTNTNPGSFNGPAAAANRLFSTSAPADMWATNVSYSRAADTWITYHVDADLRLNVTYNYEFTFTAMATTRDRQPVPIPNGWYEVDMAVVVPEIKNNLDLQKSAGNAPPDAYDRFASSSTTAVSFTNGIGKKRISLTFPYLSATSLANTLYISLTPLMQDCRGTQDNSSKKTKSRVQTPRPCIQVDSNGNPDNTRSTYTPDLRFKPYTVAIAFIPYLQPGGGNANPGDYPPSPSPADKTLAAYIAAAKARRAVTEARTPRFIKPQDFANQNGLRYRSVRDPFLQRATDQLRVPGRPDAPVAVLLARLMSRDATGSIVLDPGFEPLWVSICSALALDNQQWLRTLNSYSTIVGSTSNPYSAAVIQLCGNHPERVFRLSLIDHVWRFDAANATVQSMEPMRWGLSRNFLVSRSHSNDSIYTFSVGEPLFKLSDFFGIPLRGLGLNHLVNASDGRSQSQSESGSLGTNLDFNLVTVNLPAVRSQRCLEIRPLAVHRSPMFDETAAQHGFYICDDVSTQPRQITEVYAHTWIHMGDSTLVDVYNPLTQKVNISMRGDRDMSTFFELCRQSMQADRYDNIFPRQMLDSARQYFNNTPGATPGMVVHPVQFNRELQPSFTEMVFGQYRQDFSVER